MLTNKQVIEILEKVGYTLEEISDWSKVDLDIIHNIKKGEVEKSVLVEQSLNEFLRMNMSEVEVSKFKDKEYR